MIYPYTYLLEFLKLKRMTISNVGEDMEQMEHSYTFLLFRSFMPGRAGGEVRRGSRDRYIYISIISQNLIS